MDKKLYGKVIFKGVIKALTGLHIGASKEMLEIGGIDAPVIKHPVTGEPYIPGSSLKGKLRSLLEMKEHTENGLEFNRNIGTNENPIWIHVCDSAEQVYRNKCPVCRIFGTSGKERKDKNFPSRIKISDAKMIKFSEELSEITTEIKFENSLDRITSASNPRQIERVPAGTEFEFEIIYNVEDLEQLKGDINNILSTMELLEDDALGGHGSRGYGRVKFYFSQVVAKPIDVYFKEEKTASYILERSWNPKEPVDTKELPSIGEIKENIITKISELNWKSSET